ncbi:hypothetical protein B0A50_06683 [Salinomyces thailandicus]|uniref:FYVE-type domain-containing protein n=1 Tax=Salinomyces thailandicus TaxID=706561 RepID=A0A4U0TRJ3_9PEZI|nr:hypothetical protein B0A50_06683 [Salinomyces thailandica]
MMATTSYPSQVNNSAFFMNAPSGPSPPEVYLYGGNKGVSPSPSSQTLSSTNISPTNCNSAHMNVRQLRQPRQPMYIPAALRPTDNARPTDIPNRPRAPDTPPASKDNSFDSAKSARTPSMRSDDLPRMDSFQEDDMEALRRGLSRSASDGLEEEPGQVTGIPTTAHWKPDTMATDCALCHQTFTWYFRRHHCRRCGDVVCDNHITHRVRLDQNARYHPQGVESKACDPCWQEWNVVMRLRHSRSNSIANSQSSSQGTTVPALTIPRQTRSADEARIGSMARSEGMVWSTF